MKVKRESEVSQLCPIGSSKVKIVLQKCQIYRKTRAFVGFPSGLEKAMAPHSSTFAWKIPWMEEPGGLQSMESHRVGHD